jgi:pimeloyl-ACP methyl ester carboxylesterase
MSEAESNHGIPPDMDERPLAPPSRWELLGEGRVVIERLALTAEFHRLRQTAPQGHGETIMVVPGYATDDGWTARLREFLDSIGYDVVGWGLGRNRGNVPKLIPAVVRQTEILADDRGGRVSLVGWSLGGYLAREAARERPGLVERVITLGAPVIGGPSYTASAPGYVRKGYDLDEIKAQVVDRERQPIEVPVFAVYSRSDGVVAWRACIDRFSNRSVEHHEVRASHLGMVNSPRVFRLVAELLARPIRTGITGAESRAEPAVV